MLTSNIYFLPHRAQVASPFLHFVSLQHYNSKISKYSITSVKKIGNEKQFSLEKTG